MLPSLGLCQVFQPIEFGSELDLSSRFQSYIAGVRGRIARTVVLKLKTKEFNIHTRSHTPATPPASLEELTRVALELRDRVDLGPNRLFRLVGVGLSNFREAEPSSSDSTNILEP